MKKKVPYPLRLISQSRKKFFRPQQKNKTTFYFERASYLKDLICVVVEAVMNEILLIGTYVLIHVESYNDEMFSKA